MLARKLFMKGGRFYGSVTKLQNYRSCPYQYFLRYGIGVEERNTGEADYLDYGNYLHAGLHQFGEVLKSQNRQWRQATDEEIEKISEDITEKITPRSRRMPFPRISRQSIPAAFWIRPSGGHFKDSVNGAGRAVSTRWIWKKNSISVFPQVPLTALPLQGKIDRVDTDGRYAAVCDYKTGSPKLSLNEIMEGLSLQLITYLLALSKTKDTKDLLPAAMMYIYLHGRPKSISVPPNGISHPKEKENTNGIFLNDPDVLRTLDSPIRHG